MVYLQHYYTLCKHNKGGCLCPMKLNSYLSDFPMIASLSRKGVLDSQLGRGFSYGSANIGPIMSDWPISLSAGVTEEGEVLG